MRNDETGELRARSLLSELSKNPVFRDTLLKIGEMSPDFSLMRTFDDQDSLAEITEQVTNQVNESLRESFTQTASMKAINLMDWPSNFKEYTFMSDTLEVTTE